MESSSCRRPLVACSMHMGCSPRQAQQPGVSKAAAAMALASCAGGMSRRCLMEAANSSFEDATLSAPALSIAGVLTLRCDTSPPCQQQARQQRQVPYKGVLHPGGAAWGCCACSARQYGKLLVLVIGVW